MFERIKKLWKGGNKMVSNILQQDNQVASSSVGAELMTTKISEWLNLYLGSSDPKQSATTGERMSTMGLYASICAEMARLVTQELVFQVIDPEKEQQEGTRAEFLSRTMEQFLERLSVYTEYACAGGGVVFKPYMESEDRIAIDCSLANDFFPLAFNSAGEIIACKFVEHKKSLNKFYHRIETHKLEEQGLVVTNEAWVSNRPDAKGKKCSLSEVEEWRNLEEETVIKGVDSMLFAYFRIPIGNCIDINSPLGVSVFARAIELIEDAEKQWDRYNWELEATEAAIDVTKDFFVTSKNGTPIVPKGRERLFRHSNLDSDDKHEAIKYYNPNIREAELKAGLNTILQRIEFNVGFAYGTLSDPLVVDKTAEEIKTSKQRSYSTVSHIQMALDKALKSLVKALNAYADLYELAPDGEYTVNATWDDSIIIDAEKERARDKDDVRAGIMQKWEYRVKWYGESEDIAKQKVSETFTDNPFELK